MDECYGKYFIRNGEKLNSDLFSNSMVYDGDSVYEVIRMVKGIPVFFEDHIQRLKNSAFLQNKDLEVDTDTIRRDIMLLSGADIIKEVNLKIVVNNNEKSSGYLIYFIEPVYPTRSQYRNGVKGILISAERKDPASKVINHKLRSEIYHKLILERAYEALLVDHNNHVTEGSRSNIFFIRDNVLYTAPDEIILSGITRKFILEICREKNLKVIFEPVKADEIHDYDSVFMTGTSPMVLPFRSVDDCSFNVRNPLISELRRLYIARVADSIRNFRFE